jgi:hypothetical protein
LLPSKASYDAKSTGATVTCVGDISLSLRFSSASTAATLGGRPASSSRVNAASTPLSERRAATCKIPKYSFAARSGCRSASTS